MGYSYDTIKSLLISKRPEFWQALKQASQDAVSLEEILFLATLRKRADASKDIPPVDGVTSLRIAILGGYSLYPLRELIEQSLFAVGYVSHCYLGAYDNYTSEILDDTSDMVAFKPEVVILLPSQRRHSYQGALTDDRQVIEGHLKKECQQLLALTHTLHEKTKADILLYNFIPPPGHDLGTYRNKTLASPWSYTALLNLELGLNAPSYVQICDVHFMAARMGLLVAQDRRGWFESKQLGSPALLVAMARESARIIAALRQPMKKVLVLDLDNTIWGGVIGDAGLEGIELGDTSPRGEAFKYFQKYVLSLTERGILLAVCSKNDHDKAMEPFEKHPEMVLRSQHIVCFKANWQPKSDNIRAIAQELNLGLESFVFVDDNPAEIEIVRQFLPQVSTISLASDPSDYVGQLEDSHYFEPLVITREDRDRSSQYMRETRYKELQSVATDMDSYLSSLAMQATFSAFTRVDVPRIAQLINKSNQFNLTTKRRSESEVLALLASDQHVTCTIRLSDRFGDHGLISVVIGQIDGDCLHVDTWLMSCRVLKRQVEEEALNELVRLAVRSGCSQVVGHYLPSAKNGMVKSHYQNLGFTTVREDDDGGDYVLHIAGYRPKQTNISIVRSAK
ncbi:MAG: HAD family hydrolase [Magnetococcales bacterium]|nr:HAD family hydrolase [Magnetococcales bacterium]